MTGIEDRWRLHHGHLFFDQRGSLAFQAGLLESFVVCPPEVGAYLIEPAHGTP
ncbi:hypothetical protein ACFPIJ_05740 [Dactylosporangium cerinum]|uniref:Uncharacterized protein n=1 Tax=Dactylosporangium cerinum TaxID=1434730 RepID=A0ABV9VP01_9ACTN